MAVIEIVAITYISIHTVIFTATFCLIARSSLPEGSGLCSKAFFNKLRQTFTQRRTLAAFSILHFVDVGLDFSVMFGWYFEQNAFRKEISYNGSLLLFMIILHTISKITSSLYIYGVTRAILPTILQFFDLDIYYEMYFDQNCTKMHMDMKIEQLYRSFAVMQSFPISIMQTYLLVAYQTVAKDQLLDNSDFSYIPWTFASLLASLLFILSLQINHDAKFLNMKDKYMNVGMPKWLIRVLFRTFELLSRILLLTYIWLLYGVIAPITILTLEWIFQIYNHYRKERYDNSSDHSIRMWRKQNKFFLWPAVMDEIISFWNFDWKLPASNPLKQRTFDVVDILQGWTFASFIYGNKTIRRLTNECPPCDCKLPMDEYWTTAFDPLQANINIQIVDKSLTLENDASITEKRASILTPKCSSCNALVAIKSHYFRCPTFLRSGSIDEATETQKITKHGRYLCIECGYARMTYLPFLFVYSRNIFTWIYMALFTVFASFLDIKCSLLCIDGGTAYHESGYKSRIFLVGMACHLLSPLFFLLILTTKQMKLRQIEAKSFSGKVINYAKNLEWDKVYELIRHEECDVNEVDRSGRSAIIYAALWHNFQVIRDLQQFGADMEHVDINSCGITHYLNNYAENECDDEKISNDKLTGPTRAAKNGSEIDMHLCMELGCDLNGVDGYGHTPLLIACKEREGGILRILINESNKYGNGKVDLNKTDKDGRSAVIIVTQYGYDDLLKILLDHAQNVNVLHRDNGGISAFEHAISCNQKKCAKLIHQYKKQNDVIEQEQQPQCEEEEGEEEEEEEEKKEAGKIQLHEIKLPDQLAPVTPDSEMQGDKKQHPIPLTPDDLGTPSHIELHESDSIDRRMIRALTVDRLQSQFTEKEDYFKNINKKTMSIVVTNASV